MPDRSDYTANRITEVIERWDACAICTLRHAVPSLLALDEHGRPYSIICNDCAVSVLQLAERLRVERAKARAGRILF